jgi:hypothetical protein
VKPNERRLIIVLEGAQLETVKVSRIISNYIIYASCNYNFFIFRSEVRLSYLTVMIICKL